MSFSNSLQAINSDPIWTSHRVNIPARKPLSVWLPVYTGIILVRWCMPAKLGTWSSSRNERIEGSKIFFAIAFEMFKDLAKLIDGQVQQCTFGCLSVSINLTLCWLMSFLRKHKLITKEMSDVFSVDFIKSRNCAFNLIWSSIMVLTVIVCIVSLSRFCRPHTFEVKF